MNKLDEAALKKLIQALILEQQAAINPDDNVNDGNSSQQTLIPLAPSQIDKMADAISKKYVNNVFASVKTSLGPAYYDDNADRLYKDVKLKKSLESDFKTFVSKVLNTVAKQPTGQGEPGVGVNKTNI